MASVQEDTRTTRDGETYKDIDALGWVPADKQQKKPSHDQSSQNLLERSHAEIEKIVALKDPFSPLFMIIMEKEI